MAQVFAKTVIVLGEVNGNVTATEKVDIRDNGSVDGDITEATNLVDDGLLDSLDSMTFLFALESDLGTKLDWVAVDHFNTEHPHTHIVLRGVDESGENLIIAREYISHGLRERASELVTLDLGPSTDQEIEARLRHDVDQERLTAIDRPQ